MNREQLYRNKFMNLKIKLGQHGYTVKLVGNRVLKDYQGMNPEVIKEWGYPESGKTFDVSSKTNWEDRYKTLVHEVNEYVKMKHGSKYWPAHLYALKHEQEVRNIP